MEEFDFLYYEESTVAVDSSEDCYWEPEYRCPNCDSMYNGYYCQCCGYNFYNTGM